MSSFLIAVRFLTILPLRLDRDIDPRELGRSAAWFPLVGLGIGSVLFLVHGSLAGWLPSGLLGACLLSLWAFMTGGLHLDGLSDFFDGMFVTGDRRRRLEIMKDPHVGAFAVVGLVLVLLMKAAALASLVDARGLLLAPTVGRWMTLFAGSQPQARESGLSVGLQAGLTRGGLVAAAVLSALVTGLLGWRGLLAFLIAHLVGLVVIRLSVARLGGVTGDVLGAACELAELGVLVTFAVGAPL